MPAIYSSGVEEDPGAGISADMKKRLRAEYIGVGGSPDEPLQTNYFLYIIVAISILAVLSYYTGALVPPS